MVTDHHPLVPILNSYRLDEIENPRLQRLKSKIMAYNFSATWVKGTLNHAPDGNPASDPQTSDLLAENTTTCAEIRALTTSTQESLRPTDLRQRADKVHEYQQLKHYIHEGFPAQRSELPDHCRRYLNVRSQLSIELRRPDCFWVSSTNPLHYATLTSRPTSQCTPRVSSHKTTRTPSYILAWNRSGY